MGKILCSLYVMLFTFSLAKAGGDNPSMGARSFGLGNASVTIQDEWSLFNNIAGLSRQNKISAILAYQNLYGIPSLNTSALGVILPYKKTVWGMSFYKYGDSYLNETKAGLGCSHKIRNVSLGLKINYHQISIHENGIKRNFIIEFGGIAEITKQLFFGAHLYNLNQAKISKEKNEYIPVIMKAGLSYLPFEKLMINLETERQIDFPTIVKTGIEYSVIEKFKIRAGVSINPSVMYFGAGYKDKRFAIDYALNSHNVLGISQQISINYTFRKKNEKC